MAFRFAVDTKNSILLMSIDGVLTDQTLFDGYTALVRLHERYGACHCIVDYTGLTEVAISTAGVRNLAYTRPIFPSSCVTLNVAPEKAMFGMARMFQTLASDNRPNFRVVQTMEEALKTIGVTSAKFTPVEDESADVA